MKEGTLDLFSIEIKQSYRGFKEKVKDRPLMTGWFILLLIGGFWIVLFMVEFIQDIEDLPFTLSQGNVLFVIFFVLMSKSSVETVENTMKNEQLKHYFSAPISLRKVQFSRFLKVFWYNQILVALSLSIVSILIYSFGFAPPVDDYFFYKLYALVATAPIIGFNLGVMINAEGSFTKAVLVLLYGQNITLIWLALHSGISSSSVLYYLLFICFLSSIVLLASKEVFWRGWKNGTSPSSAKDLRFHGTGDFLPGFFDEMTRRVAEKEILVRWRKRESPATLGVTALIGGGLIFFYVQLGSDPQLGLGLDEFFYPTLIGMGVFLAVTLQVMFPALSLFGREGKAFWLIRSLPVEPRNVIRGKILAILLFSPLIPFMLVLPLSLLLSYPVERILFLLLATSLMILILGGIGVWASVRYPNFDESTNGAPDVTTMYTTMTAGLFLSGALVSVPVSVFTFDTSSGLIAMGIGVILAAAIFFGLSELASDSYEEMEMDF